MAEPSLHEDIAALGREIRDLTQRFSAKEELAKKAADLALATKRIADTDRERAEADRKRADRDRIFGIVIAVVVAIGLTLSGVAAVLGYKVATCQSRFDKANELRSALLTTYVLHEAQADKQFKDALVSGEGIPDAKRDWDFAFDQLDKARNLNPVPQYQDFCGSIPGVPDPKVPPAKKPHPTTAASSLPKSQPQ